MMKSMFKSLLLPIALAALSSGCGNCSTRGAEPIEFNGGMPKQEALTYETSRIFGEYLHFIPGRRFDLMHRLGAIPTKVSSYVSFAREPSEGSNDQDNIGNIAEASGNLVVIECADEERVRVRNDTCAEVYLRVLIEVDPDGTPADRPCF
jgi:hypothetical protein